jgi:hypothetical protein
MPRPYMTKLVTLFHQKAPAYWSATNWLPRLPFGEDIVEPGFHTGKPSDNLIDFRIFWRTEQISSSHCADTCWHTQDSAVDDLESSAKAIICRETFPVGSPGARPSTKRAWVTMAQYLFKNHRQTWHQGCRYSLTSNESWFFDPSGCERIWPPEGVIPQSRQRIITSIPKSHGVDVLVPAQVSGASPACAKNQIHLCLYFYGDTGHPIS